MTNYQRQTTELHVIDIFDLEITFFPTLLLSLLNYNSMLYLMKVFKVIDV